MPQLPCCLHDVIESPDVGLGVQTAVRVARQLAVNAQRSVLDEFPRLALLAEAERFQLQHDDVSKAVVNLGKIHVLGCHAGHPEGMRGREAEPDLEKVRTVRNVVSGVRVPFRNAHDVDGIMPQVQARSADVTTTAQAPSVSRQQSRTRNGEATMGDWRYCSMLNVRPYM